jgi:hypothetical protein
MAGPPLSVNGTTRGSSEAEEDARAAAAARAVSGSDDVVIAIVGGLALAFLLRALVVMRGGKGKQRARGGGDLPRKMARRPVPHALPLAPHALPGGTRVGPGGPLKLLQYDTGSPCVEVVEVWPAAAPLASNGPGAAGPAHLPTSAAPRATLAPVIDPRVLADAEVLRRTLTAHAAARSAAIAARVVKEAARRMRPWGEGWGGGGGNGGSGGSSSVVDGHGSWAGGIGCVNGGDAGGVPVVGAAPPAVGGGSAAISVAVAAAVARAPMAGTTAAVARAPSSSTLLVLSI